MQRSPSLKSGLAAAAAIVAALLTAAVAQPPGTALSPAIALGPDERLPADPLRDHPDGLTLHTYVGDDARQHLRVRRFGPDLAVRELRDIHPPAGYDALEWLPVSGGREVIAVLRPSGSREASGLRLVGYDVATGRQTFAHDGPPHVRAAGARLLTRSGVDASGRHFGVALVFDEPGGHGASVALLALDAAGRLVSYVAEEGITGLSDDPSLARLTVDAGGAVSFALAARDTVHLLRGGGGAAALVHRRAVLPAGHRPVAYAWAAPGGRGDVLLGIASRETPWRRGVATFALEFADGDDRVDVRLTPAPPSWPSDWRRLRVAGVTFAAPARLPSDHVAFAAQRTRRRRSGHPKQAYRSTEHVLGDILVAVVGADGTLDRAEEIGRRLRLPEGRAADATAALRLLPSPGGVGVVYAEAAGSFLPGRRPLAEASASDLTIWRPLGDRPGPGRGRILHDDSRAYRSIPGSAHVTDELACAFVTVENPTAGRPRERRIRVAMSRAR